MTLYFVLGRLGWVQLFAAPPVPHATKGWTGRLVFPLDPLRVEQLEFRSVLAQDRPRAFRLEPFGAGSRWTLVRPDPDDVCVLVDWRLGLQFCWRAVRFLDLSAVAIGQCVSLVPGDECPK